MAPQRGAAADFGLERRIDQLCWYTPLDTHRVTELQRCLNRLDLSDLLMEDGVYGEKTSKKWNAFMDRIASGSVPTLEPLDHARNITTGLGVGKDILGLGSQLYETTQAPDPFRLLGTDPLTPPTYPLVPKWDPVLGKLVDASTHRNMSSNYVQISDEALSFLQKFQSTGKIVQIAGRVLLAANIVLDAIEIGITFGTDLNSADGKIRRSTWRNAGGIAGRWAGSIAGAKVGAITIGLVGNLLFPGVGFIVGAAVGGIVFGIVGAYAGEALGEWLVDISPLGD